MKLLTVSNPKTAKGNGFGYLTAVLHLSPSNISGYQTCPMATKGCRAACLNTAGQGGFLKGIGRIPLHLIPAAIRHGRLTNTVQAARIRRTRMFFEDRENFMAQLAREIDNHIKVARDHGLIPVVRLNATSDIRWEIYKVTFRGRTYNNIFEAFPDIQFYDYTKIPNRRVSHIKNYHLTFSLADGNEHYAKMALKNGMNITVVFRNGLPAFFMGRPVWDGDKSDLRFLDPKGAIIGLKAKGRGKKDTTGFVKDVSPSKILGKIVRSVLYVVFLFRHVNFAYGM